MKNVKSKILVIDDETSICKFLRASLESGQYEVGEAHSAQEGIQSAIAFRPDLVILDLGLPDRSGHEVLRELREWSKIPIIVLTVQDADEDKVKALDHGADDYLTKPFSVPELLARIRVALRHAHEGQGTPLFKEGPLEVDRAGHTVKVKGKLIKLTATEYDLLKVLVDNAGKVVTHRMLLNTVWGPNSVEHTQYLRVYMGQIRKKLQVDESVPELIVTEPGVGYRLVTSG
ncbi:MAG: response regulator [Bacteriovoracia bacterium]